MTVEFSSQHTKSLPELLRQIGVSLLVSTYDAGQLILVRAQPDVGLNTHFVALPRPMGTAVGDDRMAVGTGFQVWEYRNLPAVAVKIEGPAAHDAVYLPREIHVTGDIDIHEMAYAGDGELWLVNTRMSCLCTLDREHSVVPRWRPPFVTAYDLADRCHLNGLAMKDGRPWLVSALGATDTPGGWRPHKVDGGLLLSVEDGDRIAEGLSMPHSPRWYRDRIWFLESGSGSLSYVDPRTGRTEVVAELPGFTRGLDFYAQFAFVGLSQVRETNVFAGLPLTHRVEERHCGVWVVDIDTGDIVAFVQFTGRVREIFAVQLLPRRFPVVLDLDHPLLPSSYALPEEALQAVAPPDERQLLFEGALLERRAGRLAEAAERLRKILEHDSGDAPALLQLGATYEQMERWEEAREPLERLLARDRTHAEAQHVLGRSHAGAGRWDDAVRCYDRAIASDRTFARAHLDRGVAHLKLGRFAQGWEGLEWRKQLPGFPGFWCRQPEWRGESIPEQTLLVHTEPGLRDAIQLARFLPVARARCRRLVLGCGPPLIRLFEAMDCVDDVHPAGAVPTDAFDVHCSLTSLAGILGVDAGSLGMDGPYLVAPPWLRNLPDVSRDGRPNVGIVWRGDAASPPDPARISSLEQWSVLVDLDARFHALQTYLTGEERAVMRELDLVPLEPPRASETHLGRTAHLIEAMDLVISVDSVVGHLAGALARPVWMLLDRRCDWRWLAAREDSPWYPTARLFQRGTGPSREDLMATVRAALAEWLADPARRA